MSAFRLYSRAPAERLRVALVHGYGMQSLESVFFEQHEIAPISGHPISQVAFIRNGIKWLRQNASRFDVFHGLQGFHLTVRPALEAERLGLPSVIKLAAHKTELVARAGWRSWVGLPRLRRRWIRDRISAVIAISKDIAAELLEYGVPESKIVEIPNGVDTRLFRPAEETEKRTIRKQFGWHDVPTILFVGMLNRRKRPHVLIHALQILLTRGIDSQLVLAGPDGEADYVEYMRGLVANLELESRVHWTGFTKNVAPLYRASDVFALISQNEGMPNALLEAMASGLPAVVTRISGTRDLVTDHKTGVFVDDNPREVAEAIAWLIDNPRQSNYLGTSARNLILEKFSTEVVIKQHEQLFHRLVAGGYPNPK